MKKIILSLIFIGGIFTSINAQQTVKGFVFEDKNQNNKFDKSEKRLANVQVSNGKQVFSTNDIV